MRLSCESGMSRSLYSRMASARTGDPDRRVPQPVADDEVAELARTLDEMLLALEASRSATEDALRRQRARDKGVERVDAVLTHASTAARAGRM
mgnify:CR=1 FL=1